MPQFAKPTRVLLVEDDDVTQTLFRRYLERAGFEVTVAGDGVEALDQAVNHPPDAIILDLMLPRMDGFGFLQALRASRSAGVPVIVISAIADAGRQSEALALGANAYLVKTQFKLNELVSTIRRHLPA